MGNKVYIHSNLMIELDGVELICYSYELVDYHKRDYDWTESHRINLTDERVALNVMRIIRDAKRTGHEEGVRHHKEKTEELINQLKKDFESI